MKGKKFYVLVGIGDLCCFFWLFEDLGLLFEVYLFFDYYVYLVVDLVFVSDGILLMIEKDVVKCVGLMISEIWVLFVEVEFLLVFIEFILEKFCGC